MKNEIIATLLEFHADSENKLYIKLAWPYTANLLIGSLLDFWQFYMSFSSVH